MAEHSVMKNAVGGKCGCVSCSGGSLPNFRVDKNKKGGEEKANEANSKDPSRRGKGGK